MSGASSTRAALLGRVRRVVVKVGSTVLASDPGSFARIAQDLARARERGVASVLVSSGAIALGLSAIGCDKRPTSIPLLQAAAAAGQPELMRRWQKAFRRHALAVAQVLLTHADLADRRRYLNARRSIEALLERGVVPVINENDTVAVDEIRFGDNDQLAAMITSLVGADLLVLLSDVEGLRDREGARVALVRDVPGEALPLVEAPPGGAPKRPGLGSGGMASKLESARRAGLYGVRVVIAPGLAKAPVERVLAGEDVGTLVLPPEGRLPSRKHWIGFTLRPRGALVVDDGALRALRAGKSLLPAGIVAVEGDFEVGDPIAVRGKDGADVARGLSAYGAAEVERIRGLHTRDIAKRLGYESGGEVIHRDDLVLV